MEKVRVGLVGFGGWGRRHYETLTRNPRVRLVGIYDPKFKGGKFFASLEGLLGEVDAADVVVPPKHLARVARKALQAGKHVFIEKPMAVNAQEARMLKRVHDRHPMISQVGFIERFNPVFNALRVISREIKPTQIFCQRSGKPTLVARETGALKDLAIHDVDLLRWMFGEPESASAVSYHNGNMGQIRLTFPRMEATIIADCLGPLKIRRWVFESRRRTVTANFEGVRWRLFHGDQELDVPWIAPLSVELGQFARSVIEGTEPEPGIDDGLRVLQLIESAMAQGKRWARR